MKRKIDQKQKRAIECSGMRLKDDGKGFVKNGDDNLMTCVGSSTVHIDASDDT